MSQTKKVKLIETEVTESLACDNCGAAIPLVGCADGLSEQGDNALIIQFLGGYGMFVDPLVQYNLRMLFCEKCAQELGDKFPSIGKRIERGYKVTQPAISERGAKEEA